VEVGGFDGADPVVAALEGCAWAAGCAAATCSCGCSGSGASGSGGRWDSRVRARETLRIVFKRLARARVRCISGEGEVKRTFAIRESVCYLVGNGEFRIPGDRTYVASNASRSARPRRSAT